MWTETSRPPLLTAVTTPSTARPVRAASMSASRPWSWVFAWPREITTPRSPAFTTTPSMMSPTRAFTSPCSSTSSTDSIIPSATPEPNSRKVTSGPIWMIFPATFSPTWNLRRLELDWASANRSANEPSSGCDTSGMGGGSGGSGVGMRLAAGRGSWSWRGVRSRPTSAARALTSAGGRAGGPPAGAGGASALLGHTLPEGTGILAGRRGLSRLALDRRRLRVHAWWGQLALVDDDRGRGLWFLLVRHSGPSYSRRQPSRVKGAHAR